MSVRKADSARQRHGEARTELARPEARRIVAPPPPPNVLPATLARWSAFWGSELADYIRVTDLPALERLFVNLDELERTRADLYAPMPARPRKRKGETSQAYQRRQGEWNMAQASRGRLVRDPRGGYRLNPLLVQMRALEKNVIALEDRFGGTLRARQELGLNEIRARTLTEHNAQVEAHADETIEDDADDPRAVLRIAPPHRRRS